MKKKNILILILIFVLTIVGCKPILGFEEVDVNVSSSELTISDYFPFTENKAFYYEGIGNEFAEQMVYFEFIEDNKAQLKIMNPATNVVRVLEYEEGQLREIYNEGEFYHIENMLGFKGEQTNIVLAEPLEVGNSWTTADGFNRSITGLDVDIETPMGSYKALEVTTEFDDGRMQKQYYVRDIGMVASIFKDGDSTIETLLKSIEDGPLVIDIEAYYPLYSDIKTAYINEKINFYTNGSIEKLLEDILKNPPNDELISVIPDSVIINSIKLDRSSWTLRVDFSQELLTDLNIGSSMETEILKSIVNTLGRLYDVENVYISIEGRPYESGHYAIRDDEFFNVDIEEIQKYE
ncbi:MAG: GerMN domain-containing protein [Tissierella sp.]|nr:GerMN domain-containing protein [Tissierella sp.]